MNKKAIWGMVINPSKKNQPHQVESMDMPKKVEEVPVMVSILANSLKWQTTETPSLLSLCQMHEPDSFNNQSIAQLSQDTGLGIVEVDKATAAAMDYHYLHPATSFLMLDLLPPLNMAVFIAGQKGEGSKLHRESYLIAKKLLDSNTFNAARNLQHKMPRLTTGHAKAAGITGLGQKIGEFAYPVFESFGNPFVVLSGLPVSESPTYVNAVKRGFWNQTPRKERLDMLESIVDDETRYPELYLLGTGAQALNESRRATPLPLE